MAENLVTVTITDVQGSAPREVGANMTVYASGQDGSIGGGALEWEATRIAQDMLTTETAAIHRTFPLGPDLGQCCGGTVKLAFAREAAKPAAREPIWIWGGGHVGRAIATILAPLDAFAMTLIDTTADRMPTGLPEQVTPLVAADPLRVVPLAPPDARHLVLTYSHDLDLALCDALLRHGFVDAGLIGSKTKWTRFQRRLHAMGHTTEEISRITCPIGNPTLGKHPQAIAIGVASAFLSLQQASRVEDNR